VELTVLDGKSTNFTSKMVKMMGNLKRKKKIPLKRIFGQNSKNIFSFFFN